MVQQHLDRLGVRPLAGAYMPLSAEQLHALEARVGSLPKDYRAFLASVGRCGFEGSISIHALSGQRLPFAVLYGAPVEGRQDDVFWGLDDDELGAGWVIIGDDELGEPFALEASTGSVYRVENGTPALVASSFTDLLSRAEVRD